MAQRGQPPRGRLLPRQRASPTQNQYGQMQQSSQQQSQRGYPQLNQQQGQQAQQAQQAQQYQSRRVQQRQIPQTQQSQMQRQKPIQQRQHQHQYQQRQQRHQHQHQQQHQQQQHQQQHQQQQFYQQPPPSSQPQLQSNLAGQMSQTDNANVAFDTRHQDLIHDAQLDYYGKTLATASSDRVIKLFEVTPNKQTHITDLIGHQGPVWRVSWADPKFGQVLASCGYDRKVIIWKYNPSTKQWSQWYIDDDFQSSVNCIQFAPVDLGLELIAGCADGNITIYSYSFKNNRWNRIDRIEAHNGGVNSISWSQQTSTVTLLNDNSNNNKNKNNNNNNNKDSQNINRLTRQFASGGCDSTVKIWNFNYENGKFENSHSLVGHQNWIRDVSWAPIPGSASHGIVASCSEDQSVIIWKEQNNKWKLSNRLNFKNKVWSVSWSELGNILGVASGENSVQLFKEGLDGHWHDISKISN